MSNGENGPTFSQKTIYQSWFRQTGPLIVKFRTRSTASKYKDKPPFAGFTVQGDQTSYMLQIENARIEEKINGVVLGKWYKVTCMGGGEDDSESADILIEDTEPGEARPSAMQYAESYGYNCVRDMGAEALAVAREQIGELAEAIGHEIDPEVVCSWATALMIRSERFGLPLLPPAPVERREPVTAGDASISTEQAQEIVALAEACNLSNAKRREIEEWLATGPTIADYMTLKIRLEKRMLEAGTPDPRTETGPPLL